MHCFRSALRRGAAVSAGVVALAAAVPGSAGAGAVWNRYGTPASLIAGDGFLTSG